MNKRHCFSVAVNYPDKYVSEFHLWTENFRARIFITLQIEVRKNIVGQMY